MLGDFWFQIKYFMTIKMWRRALRKLKALVKEAWLILNLHAVDVVESSIWHINTVDFHSKSESLSFTNKELIKTQFT